MTPQTKVARKRRWIILIVIGAIAAGIIWVTGFNALAQCQYRPTEAELSEDGNYYFRMDITLCKDHEKSKSTLIMGKTNSETKVVVLELGSNLGKLNVGWLAGPVLAVRLNGADVIQQYSQYPGFPVVRVSPK